MRKKKIPGYASWIMIKNRCENANAKCFYRYGGRGIKICKEWRDDFEKFVADMGPRPSLAHSVDRIDNDRDYEPGNCRWATKREQNNNRENTRYVEYRGQRMSINDAVRLAGSVVHNVTAWNRINRNGCDVAEAVETPALKKGSWCGYSRKFLSSGANQQ